ncbi:9682_t:CDS:2, partial [Dentiscutata heterogama]
DIWPDSQLRLPHSNQLALLTSYEAFYRRMMEVEGLDILVIAILVLLDGFLSGITPPKPL